MFNEFNDVCLQLIINLREGSRKKEDNKERMEYILNFAEQTNIHAKENNMIAIQELILIIAMIGTLNCFSNIEWVEEFRDELIATAKQDLDL